MNIRNEDRKPHVVVIGAGFGGLRAVRALRNAPVQVTLIDRNNFHLFQPLLYQVATSAISPDDIAYPVRAIFHGQENFDFRLATVLSIDLQNRCIETTMGQVSYDFLILAPGGETNYFNLESVEKHAIGLKELGDAISIRNHLLTLFEQATEADNPDLCHELLTFVLVGGGPTGVEMSGSLSELVRLILKKDFPDQDLSYVRVILLEMMDRLLVGMPEELSEHTQKVLEKRGVEVRLGESLADFDGRRAVLKSGEVIPTRTVIWAAGVKAVSLLQSLGVPTARQGRVVVNSALQIPDHPEVFVIGDAAYLEDDGGAPLPMVAPVAMQQGEQAAENVVRILKGEQPEKFRYKDPGTLATIGRNQAVAQLGRLKFSGFPAWVVWLVVHLIQLIGFRNKLVVLVNWAVDYIFYTRALRLIVPRETET